MARRKAITAEELARQLESDPERVAKRDARAARLAELETTLAADEASILADLSAVGVTVSSVYDLVGTRVAPPEALPVLLRHLGVDHHERIREGLIRSLGVPGARELASGTLRAEYAKERDPGLRIAIANALAGMGDPEEFERLTRGRH